MTLLERLSLDRARPVHLIGIGGIGLSGIARILHREGIRVQGSDRRPSPVTDALLRLGIRVLFGQRGENVPEDAALVIASAAVPPQNPEIVRARALTVPVMKYAEALGALMRGRRGIAVAGTHGKTTTTAMTAHILIEAGLDPTMVVGGNIPLLGGTARIGRSDLMVAEACEFDRSFLALRPTHAIVTNIEADHLDYYSGIDEIREAFRAFAERVDVSGALVCSGEDPSVAQALAGAGPTLRTFAVEADAHVVARRVRPEGGRPRFEVWIDGRRAGRAHLRVPGLHNVRNALAAIEVCRAVGVAVRTACAALETFPGVDRRFHLLHEQDGVAVVDDYAHHPTEVRATLRAARERFPAHRLVCVFQAHQYSRTRHLKADFVDALREADLCLLPDIYQARDNEEDRRAISAGDLAEALRAAGVEADHVPGLDDIALTAADLAKPGTVILTLGAGDVYRVGGKVRDLLLLRDEHAGRGRTRPRERAAGSRPAPDARASGRPRRGPAKNPGQ